MALGKSPQPSELRASCRLETGWEGSRPGDRGAGEVAATPWHGHPLVLLSDGGDDEVASPWGVRRGACHVAGS